MMNMKCPKCGSNIEVADGQAGQSVTCAQCGNVCVAPPAAEPAAAQSEVPPPSAPSSTTPPVQAGTEKDARMWGMLCHLAALAGFVGVPFGNIIGPLVVWMIQKDKYPSVVKHGKEALNFQISMTIYTIVSAILCFAIIGFLLLPALVVLNVVFVIIAAVKANNGEHYHYPLTIRFLK